MYVMMTTKYFSSIGEFGGFTMHMTICLVLAWFVVYLCVMKGIKSSGKVTN